MDDAGSISKSDQIYFGLKDLVMRGHFKAGERLTEAKVARLLRVGRGPVRESILRLEAEGLLSKPGSRRSRTVAPSLDEDNIQDLISRYELREQIDGGACRLAAKHMNGWQIDHLRELARGITEADHSGEHEKRYQLNAEFYKFLVANCGNSLFQQVWEQCRLAPERPRTLEREREILAQIPPEQRENPSLIDVVDAIASHDPDEAEKRIRVRTRRIVEALRKDRRIQNSAS